MYILKYINKLNKMNKYTLKFKDENLEALY